MAKNIVLIGLMGSGKTTLGKHIAEKSGMDFVDTDELIVQKAGKSINQIFAEDGSEHFRDLESEVILEVSKKSDCIVSTGGGAVLRDENVDNLRSNGVLFYLEASADVLYERVKNDDSRPLLKGDDPVSVLKRVLAEREPLYSNADYRIDSTKPLESVTKRVLELYQQHVQN